LPNTKAFESFRNQIYNLERAFHMFYNPTLNILDVEEDLGVFQVIFKAMLCVLPLLRLPTFVFNMFSLISPVLLFVDA
jgi:hypothetical protein